MNEERRNRLTDLNFNQGYKAALDDLQYQSKKHLIGLENLVLMYQSTNDLLELRRIKGKIEGVKLLLEDIRVLRKDVK